MSQLPWDPPPRRRRRALPVLFTRRSWWVTLGVVFLTLGVAGAVGAYALHGYLSGKAATFDMADLGRMESASTIYDRRGQVFGHIYLQNREPVTLAQVAPDLQHAVLAAEDAGFYTHTGYNFKRIVAASVKNLGAGRTKQGASTITQQLARNTFPLGGRDLKRKLLEVYVARRIETTLTKDQILEYYLNRIYLGSGLYGVEAASKGYFGHPAKDLTLGEAATLAGLIKSPNNLSPWNNKTGSQTQRNFVLGRMAEVGLIPREQANATAAEALSVKPRTFAATDSYAVEAIRQRVVDEVGADEAVSKGYKIYATVDAELQRVAETALRQGLDAAERHPAFQALNHPSYAAYQQGFKEELAKVATATAANPKAPAPNVHANLPDPAYLQGALVALNNADGGILAVVGGRDFKHSEYNRALSNTARRPMGTAFTPLVFAAAYQKGTVPNTLILDQNIDNRQVMIGGETGILGEWGVERADNRYEGPMAATVALAKGKNAAAVRLGNEVGLTDILALGKRAGLTSPLREFPNTILGSSEISLSELAMAYTTFPNGGWRPGSPYIITKIVDNEGTVVFQAKPGARTRVVDEVPAYQVHNALAESLKWGTARAATAHLGLQPAGVGGKTGTAYNFTDAVFCGYNSELTCGVWMGFDNARTPIYRGAFGSELALPVWTQVLNAAAAIQAPKEIPRPAALRRVELCSESGELATDRCFEEHQGERRRTTYFEYLPAAKFPKRACPVHTSAGNRLLALDRFGRNYVRVGGIIPNAPKATSPVDLNQFQPVVPKAPTILGSDGRDPYGTLQPIPPDLAPTPAAEPDPAAPPAAGAVVGATPGADVRALPPTPTPTPEREVRRAAPVSPYEQEVANKPVQIEKPAPLDFN